MTGAQKVPFPDEGTQILIDEASVHLGADEVIVDLLIATKAAEPKKTKGILKSFFVERTPWFVLTDRRVLFFEMPTPATSTPERRWASGSEQVI